jgi:integrase
VPFTLPTFRGLGIRRMLLPAFREHFFYDVRLIVTATTLQSGCGGHKPLLRRAGLPTITLHTLRHTAATLLLSQGTHPVLVQHLLGHSTVAMTLDKYSHWTPSMGEQTAKAMEAALS